MAAASSAVANPPVVPPKYKEPFNTALIAPIVVSLLFLFLVWAWWRGLLVGKYSKGKPDRLLVWLRRKVGSKRTTGGWQERQGNLEVVQEEVIVVNGHTIPQWLVRWMRKKFGGDAAVVNGEARRSEEGLLVVEGKGGAAPSKSSGAGSDDASISSRPAPMGGDTIEEIAPPPYAAAESSAGPSGPSGPSTTRNAHSSAVPVITLTTTTTITTRTWKDTASETR